MILRYILCNLADISSWPFQLCQNIVIKLQHVLASRVKRPSYRYFKKINMNQNPDMPATLKEEESKVEGNLQTILENHLNITFLLQLSAKKI